jgi:UDP-N-acetylmuramate dehydrogenase
MRLATLDLPNLKRSAPLAKYTAARLGGSADWLYVTGRDEPIEQLVEVVQAAWDAGLPVRVIGGGANILVSDRGVRGLVVVNRITQIQYGAWHGGRTVSATAGTRLLRLARGCAKHGIAGMEWAIGVPGTVGGAIVNNAGAHGADMADSVADVVVYTAIGGAQLYTAADLDYDYRYSALKARSDRRFVVLLATFALPPDDRDAIQARMADYNAYRKRTQPPGASLGSIFKNPPDDYAGRLIQVSGLKGYQQGGVQVSDVHANFIVNHTATASAYYALIEHVRATVYRQQGVELELEIELVGDWS